MKQQQFNPSPDLSPALSAYAPDFSPFFETRLMGKIAQLKEESYDYIFSHAFRKILFSGVAAVALLLITILISDGSLSVDALVGTSNLDLESLTALTLSGN